MPAEASADQAEVAPFALESNPATPSQAQEPAVSATDATPTHITAVVQPSAPVVKDPRAQVKKRRSSILQYMEPPLRASVSGATIVRAATPEKQTNQRMELAVHLDPDGTGRNRPQAGGPQAVIEIDADGNACLRSVFANGMAAPTTEQQEPMCEQHERAKSYNGVATGLTRANSIRPPQTTLVGLPGSPSPPSPTPPVMYSTSVRPGSRASCDGGRSSGLGIIPGTMKYEGEVGEHATPRPPATPRGTQMSLTGRNSLVSHGSLPRNGNGNKFAVAAEAAIDAVDDAAGGGTGALTTVPPQPLSTMLSSVGRASMPRTVRASMAPPLPVDAASSPIKDPAAGSLSGTRSLGLGGAVGRSSMPRSFRTAVIPTDMLIPVYGGAATTDPANAGGVDEPTMCTSPTAPRPSGGRGGGGGMSRSVSLVRCGSMARGPSESGCLSTSSAATAAPCSDSMFGPSLSVRIRTSMNTDPTTLHIQRRTMRSSMDFLDHQASSVFDRLTSACHVAAAGPGMMQGAARAKQQMAIQASLTG